MFQHEIEKLTVGSIVGISPQYGETYLVDAVVQKVNGHGHIIVKAGNREIKFDKRGREYKRDSERFYFEIVDNATAKSRNAAAQAQTQVNLKVNNLLEAVAKAKAYKGYHITPEVKQNLLRLVNEL